MTDQHILNEVLQTSRHLVLLLGQQYLSSSTGQNPLLSLVAQGPVEKPIGEWWFETGEAIEPRAQRLDKASRLFPIGNDWRFFRELPWRAVFASAFDTVVRRLLELDGRRQVHQWFSPARTPSEQVLPLFRLFGSVERDATSELPPATPETLRVRRSTAADILRPLGEIVGPHGALLIEGWKPSHNDWLRVRDLAGAILAAQFTVDQVLIGGVDDLDEAALRQDDDMADLLDRRVIRLLRAPLSECVQRLREAGHRFKVDDRVQSRDSVLLPALSRFAGALGPAVERDLVQVAIGREEYRQLSETFRILDPLDLSEPVAGTPLELRRACQRFLETAPDQAVNRIRQFAFRRPFFDTALLPALRKALDTASPQDHTVLLCGQSGAGKTTLLCLLAIELRMAGLPVAFVPRSVVPPNQAHLDRFVQLLEAAGSACPVVVVWDGLEAPHAYQKLSRFFASRGRKALVIGSSYELLQQSGPESRASRPVREVPAPTTTTLSLEVKLSEQERNSLLAHFEVLMPDETAALREYHNWQSYDNFFATLYYLFDGLRPRLQKGLLDELQRTIDELCRALKDRITAIHTTKPQGDLQLALIEALGHNFTNTLAEAPGSPEATGRLREEVLALVNAVMVAAWAGLPLPQSLALRLLTDKSVAYKEALRAAPFIREIEESEGYIYLDARHPLEADLWCQNQISGKAQRFNIIDAIVRTLGPAEAIDDRSRELEFVVKLLQAIGPQGRAKCKSPEFFLRIAQTIETIAESVGGDIHPRLLLVQANAVREGVRESQMILSKRTDASVDDTKREVHTWVEKLRQAEQALLRAQEHVSSKAFQGRLAAGARNFLVVAKTERAAVLGAQLGSLRAMANRVPIDSTKLKVEADGVFKRARTAWREAISLDEENQPAYDIASWIIRDRIDLGQLTDDERLDAIADWMQLLEEYGELVDTPDQTDKFDTRDRECAIRRGDSAAALEALSRMLRRGSPAAHTLRAREIELDSSGVGGVAKAKAYLEQHCGPALLTDRHVLLLYYRLWWATETKHSSYFPVDHLLLAFRPDQWKRLATIATARLGLEGESGNRLALFHLGWAQLQAEDATAALATFRLLGSLSEGAFRRGRSLSVISDGAGRPKVFHGENRGVYEGQRGRVWIDDLRQEIPYNAFDFEDMDRRKGAPFGPFHIALNYRGPFVQPVRRTPVQKG